MKSTKCVQCGFVGWSDLENCKACGAPLNQGSGSFLPAVAHYGSGHQSGGDEKGLAIAGLVLGIVSFMTLGMFMVGGIVGIVLSAKAMGKVKREPWRYGGRGMAVAGLVLSIISLTCMFMIIAIPNAFHAYRAANEGSAQSSMRTICKAEVAYQEILGKYGTLQELAAANLIDPKLASGTKSGYAFNVTLDSENLERFELTGVPETYGKTGVRSFYVDEKLVLRGADNDGEPLTRMDEPLDSR
jgi:hypothetical protein